MDQFSDRVYSYDFIWKSVSEENQYFHKINLKNNNTAKSVC